MLRILRGRIRNINNADLADLAAREASHHINKTELADLAGPEPRRIGIINIADLAGSLETQDRQY